MREKIIKYLLAAACGFLFSVLFASGAATEAQAQERAAQTVEIRDEEDLWRVAAQSRGWNFAGDTLTLLNDIELTYAGHEGEALTIGNADLPFAGVFEGNGYTITGLKYEEDPLTPSADTGLFGSVRGASIRNLVLKDADIDADVRGGIAVGYSEDSEISGVRVEGGGLSVAAADNVLLIGTDLGIRGGGIVGEAKNSVLYNCEVRDCFIRSNNTAGVAALAGKPLTLGGIAGCAEASTIEYCRVTGEAPYDTVTPDDSSDKTRISIHYDVAVGALGGNTLYVGGIAGRIWSDDEGTGTKIIDSFSTADMYYYCATYVSVIGVNIGHIGGVTAEVWDSGCEITRCHYAGTTASEQWNPILVIPIIQKNVNIDGVADLFSGDKNKVTGTHFKPSLNPGVDMETLVSSASTGTAGPWSDELYENRDAWEAEGYDFTGSEPRDSAYSDSHVNKWVMDYDLGIPVHGNSVAADLDFPGAGSVTIDGTGLVNAPVSTDDPYNFAVQGYSTYDSQIKITAGLTEVNGQEEAFRVEGWYLKRGGEADRGTVTDIRSYYGAVTGDEDNKVGEEDTYTADTQAPEKGLENGDLYVAHCQAQVLFHDINGAVIDRTTGATEDTADLTDDYYDYQAQMESREPLNLPGNGSEEYKFYGWTDVPKEGTLGGYAGITSDVLEELRAGGHIYQSGDSVEKPLKLYPIYTDFKNNIITVIEGYDVQDDGTPVYSRRTGVGSTTTEVDENGDIQICALPESGVDWEAAGYVFRGWYEVPESTADYNNPVDAAGNSYPGILLTKNTEYKLDGADFSRKHVYVARFEYRVDYYVEPQGVNGWESIWDSSQPYYSDWQPYNSPFKDLDGPAFMRVTVVHWGNQYRKDDSAESCTDYYTPDNLRITSPFCVYSHTTNQGSGGNTNYNIYVDTDFPGSGYIEDVSRGTDEIYCEFIFTPDSSRYHLLFWTLEREGGLLDGAWSYAGSGSERHLETYVSAANNYKGRAFVTADLHFYQKGRTEGQEYDTVTRRYGDPVFLETEFTEDFYYPHIYTDERVDARTEERETIETSFTARPSPEPEDLTGDGYCFLGWIDGSISQAEKDYIYDVEGDEYCTSDARKVIPYLLDEETLLVTEAMDLYPVYVKPEIIRTTNIAEKGVASVGDYVLNLPEDPAFLLKDGSTTDVTLEGLTIHDDGTASFTLVVEDGKTPVYDGAEQTYQFDRLEAVTSDGKRTILQPDAGSNGLTFTVENLPLGQSCKYIAYYEPLLVIYHLNDDETDVEFRNTGESLGAAPQPLYSSDEVGTGYSLAGWTTEKPNIGGRQYYLLDSYDDLTGIPVVRPEDRVTDIMELYPVYAPVKIQVCSNIDSLLTEAEKQALRYLNSDLITGTVTVNAQDSTTVAGRNYVFTGWKKVEQDIRTDFSEDRTAVVETVFEEAIYEAQYETGYTVNYHTFNESGEDEILWSVLISEHADRAQEGNAGFVHEITVTRPDPDDPDETISEEMTVPYDITAFEKISSSLTGKEPFEEWQWVKPDGTCLSWAEFSGEPVREDMELYPVIWKTEVTRTDERDPSQTVDLLTDGSVILQVDFEPENEDGAAADEEAVVNINFSGVYAWPDLKVTVTRQQGTTAGFTGVRDIPVNIYSEYTVIPPEDPTDPDAQPGISKKLLASGKTDDIGVAEFSFEGELVLKKELSSKGEDFDGQPYIFTVSRLNENGEVTDSTKVVVRAGEDVTMKLPFGTYSVEEERGWAWRYVPEYTVDTSPPEEAGNRVKSEYGESGGNTGVDADPRELSGSVYINSRVSTVICRNSIRSDHDKWFDHSTDKENVFGIVDSLDGK